MTELWKRRKAEDAADTLLALSTGDATGDETSAGDESDATAASERGVMEDCMRRASRCSIPWLSAALCLLVGTKVWRWRHFCRDESGGSSRG